MTTTLQRRIPLDGGNANALVFRELILQRALDGQAAVQRVLALLADPTLPWLVIELHGCSGQVRYLVGATSWVHTRVAETLGGQATQTATLARQPLQTARRLTISTTARPLLSDPRALTVTAPAILGTLAGTGPGERLALQVLIGPRLKPRLV